MDKLESLRKQIDALDGQLLHVIHERLQIVAKVGKIKKELGQKPLDSTRWAQVLETRLKKAEELGLRRDFVQKILDTIHEEALLIEKQ